MSQSAQNIVPGEKLNSNGVFMFELKDLTDDYDFNASDYRLNPREFFEKRPYFQAALCLRFTQF